MLPQVDKLCNNIRRILNVNYNGKLRFLDKPNVLEWVFNEPKFINSLTKEKEKSWGVNLIGKSTNQWTTLLGEHILHDILVIKGENPRRIAKVKKGFNGKGLNPDFITDIAMYENKARTYKVSGTAGEKVLGAATKYCDCPDLYNKPLYIVCMAYQEVEGDTIFDLFKPKSSRLKGILDYYHKECNIKYVKATDLILENTIHKTIENTKLENTELKNTELKKAELENTELKKAELEKTGKVKLNKKRKLIE